MTTATNNKSTLQPPHLPHQATTSSNKNTSRAQPQLQRPKRETANFFVGGAIVCLTVAVATLLVGGCWVFSSSSIENDNKYACVPQLVLDIRSLAAGRIFLGLLILLDLRERFVDLVPFYTDAGCCPRHVLLAPGGEPRLASSDISFYFATGSNATVALLMLTLGGASSLCFLLGYQTRLATLGCWLHWRSIETRTVAVHQAGDLIMRLLIWWCLFLPMGAVYSVDSSYQNDDTTTTATVAISRLAAFGLILQLSWMYFMSVMFKVDSAWKDGTAVRLVLLNFGHSRTPISSWVISLPTVVTWGLTKSTIWVEFSVLPLLLLSGAPSVRLAVAIVLMGFHLGLGMTMRLGLFPAICIAGWILLIPGFAWDFLGAAIPTLSGTAAEHHGYSSAAPQTVGSSWVEVAIMSISILLAIRSNLAKLPTTRLSAMMQLSKQRQRIVTWSDWISVFLASLWCRICTAQEPFETELCRLLGQNQQWFMFDVPSRTDCWFVSVGHCEDGSRIDIFGSLYYGTTIMPVLTSPPPQWQVAYRSHRWRKFVGRLTEKRYAALRTTYATFLVERWNATASPGKAVKRLELHCVKRRINLTEETHERVEQSAVLWNVDIESACESTT